MQLAVSNLAWDVKDDHIIFPLLRMHGIHGIEVAPTKIWPDWEGISERSVRQYADYLSNEGFLSPSLQAIVYGLPHLMLFGDASIKKAFLEHLKKVADIASVMQAGRLVFGAPRNRLRGSLGLSEAFAAAVQFFCAAAAICHSRGTRLCIEPNPEEYGCDFITNTTDAINLVTQVMHPGFGLHLDSGSITLAGENIADTICRAGTLIWHFHASEPHLADFSSPKVDHSQAGATLRSIGYKNWVAIEMVKRDDTFTVLDDAIKLIKKAYFL